MGNWFMNFEAISGLGSVLLVIFVLPCDLVGLEMDGTIYLGSGTTFKNYVYHIHRMFFRSD